ncbi:hypothetical protein H634G_01994 [Metarhizium anisopliae BRIP 53293]|uniref:Uncharacterized protein n=1 Tax=Metarhizium anisopliae BRIP 53293 TaxID=1291518 RepID=A0A0D9P9B1_METAN|nr:hypothetical protein H634G_01994 [Metarhizium anisopliae BRIP 53293]KJK93490.1 hypothetical protein H633G_02691 [Metarhizium anisopliae BRIP 53284]
MTISSISLSVFWNERYVARAVCADLLDHNRPLAEMLYACDEPDAELYGMNYFCGHGDVCLLAAGEQSLQQYRFPILESRVDKVKFYSEEAEDLRSTSSHALTYSVPQWDDLMDSV